MCDVDLDCGELVPRKVSVDKNLHACLSCKRRFFSKHLDMKMDVKENNGNIILRHPVIKLFFANSLKISLMSNFNRNFHNT